MDLPKWWPGRVRVRQALTLLRLHGHWDAGIQRYATAGRHHQKQRYKWFREVYYWELYRKDPDRIRIGK